MSKQPWIKFYPSDWRSDPKLRMCSLAARGAWIELLGVMHEATPRGHLLIGDRQPTLEQIASLLGAYPQEVETLLAELESAGVFSRKKNGVIYSRRMERDENRSRKNRENGKMGGNPSLCKDKENEGSLNPEVKTQKLEARSQKLESSSSARAGETVSNQHRAMALELIDRGKTNLSNWEQKFLRDLCSKPTLTASMKKTLDDIAIKVGVTADAVLATWRKRLDAARRMRQWDAKWGPPPGKIGCLVPDELQQPGDGEGWTEWKAAS